MALGDQAGVPAVQAFLAGAPAIIQKLVDAGHADEAEIIQALHDALSQGAAILKPFSDQLARVADVAESFKAFAAGFDVSVTPKAAQQVLEVK